MVKERNLLPRIGILLVLLAFLYPKLSRVSWNPSQLCDIPENGRLQLPEDSNEKHQRCHPKTSSDVQYCSPRKLHISQADDVNENHTVSMTVSFSVPFECRDVDPSVVYGQQTALPHPGKVARPNHPPLQFNYSSSKTDGSIYRSDWIYHIRLPNLEAGMKKYWYRITVNPGQVEPERPRRLGVVRSETSVYVFSTPPLPHSPTSLALVGDLGQTENSTKTMMHIWGATQETRYLSSVPVSQLLIAGDLSYADSEPNRWDSWWDLIQPLSRSTTMHVAAGNHEIECDTSNRVFVPYEHWFRNPNRVSEPEWEPISDSYRATLWEGSCSAPSEFVGKYDYGNSFYAYKHGLAQFIILNS